jgi:hypothetical protein
LLAPKPDLFPHQDGGLPCISGIGSLFCHHERLIKNDYINGH